MLDIVRNLVSSIFGKILLAIMVLSFALWGVGDILTSGNSQLAAKVGKEKITLNEFYIKLQESIETYNINNASQLNVNDAVDLGLHNLVLNDLIFSKMVNNYSKNQGIYLNDNSFKLIIKGLPQFKNENNNFSELKYKNYVLNNFPSEEVFLKQLESIILKGIIFENFNINNFLNKSIINILYNYEGEKRNIEYFLIGKEMVNIKTSSNSELEKYFQENIDKYKIPEQIIINYIELKIEDFQNVDNINDNQVKQYYENNIRLYTKEETRKIEFARFNNKNEADKFVQSFENKSSQDLKNQLISDNIKLSSIEKYNGGTFPDEIKEIIFQLKLNQSTPPISIGDLGYYLIRVKDISKKKTLPIEDVYRDIRDYLSLEDAYELYDASLNNIDEMLLNDFTIEEISSEIKDINIVKNTNINELLSKDGFDKESLINRPVGFVSEIIFNNNNAYVVEIVNKLEITKPRFEQVIDIVEDDYTKSLIEREIQSKIDKALIQLQFKGYESFKKFAEINNLEIKSFDHITRQDNKIKEDTITKLFELEENIIFEIQFNDQDSGIGIVKKIIKADEIISDTFYENIKENIKNNFNNSLETTIANEIINQTEYEIFTQNIDNLLM